MPLEKLHYISPTTVGIWVFLPKDCSSYSQENQGIKLLNLGFIDNCPNNCSTAVRKSNHSLTQKSKNASTKVSLW